MLRLPYLSLLAGILALGAVTASAQTTGSASMQTVSGAGYSYQVPSSWQLMTSSMQQKNGDQLITNDGTAQSPDGNQHAFVQTASGFGISSDHLADVLGAFLGAGQGGNQSGTPPIASLAGPESIQVANADSALSGAVVYTDGSGTQRVAAAHIALRNGTTYVLVLDVTKDFYQSDPTFASIIGSLQLSGQ